MSNGEQTQQLQLYVVPGTLVLHYLAGDGFPKIKLNWCGKLENWKILHTSQLKGKGTNQTLEHLLKKYDAVFNGQMGTVKGFIAKLVLRDDATPKFSKTRWSAYPCERHRLGLNL